MEHALIGCGRIAAKHIHAALNNHLHIAAVCGHPVKHVSYADFAWLFAPV